MLFLKFVFIHQRAVARLQALVFSMEHDSNKDYSEILGKMKMMN